MRKQKKGAKGARHVLKLCCKTYFFCSSEKHYVVTLHRVITASEQSSVRVRTRATKKLFPSRKVGSLTKVLARLIGLGSLDAETRQAPEG